MYIVSYTDVITRLLYFTFDYFITFFFFLLWQHQT